MSPSRELFTSADLEQLTARGIDEADAHAQIELLRNPPGHADIDRPATVGDGIDRLAEDRVDAMARAGESAAAAERAVKFVPASGAATRMFRGLLGWRDAPPRTGDALREAADAGDDGARDVMRLLEERDRFAFVKALRETLAARREELDVLAESRTYSPVLAALLDSEAMAYAELPKGLLLFHGYPDGPRTPFEEHLREAAACIRGGDGRCGLHVTVSPEHRDRFAAHLEHVRERLEPLLGVSYEVGFSTQSPATDTLALGADDRPVRHANGSLLFRPGGHGSLLGNLASIDADIVVLKNIDNVVPDPRAGARYRWQKALIGVLAGLRDEVHALVGGLEPGGDPPDASVIEKSHGLARAFGRAVRPGEAREREDLLAALDRPIRVCGMVPNVGEPGGGPFWVRGEDGSCTPQVVETSQMDPDSEHVRSQLAAATHFNPVDVVACTRRHDGARLDLGRFVDPRTAFITKKSLAGKELRALERPGLWNGAMAHWNTRFVEVPLETFAPVKTVFDLLRPEHQVRG